ncbi:MAG: hypothetical protein OEM28_12065 [Nitrosopumilus sp.]|nr:hypothetical protein [Nitrosopumilus sp.]
MKIIVIKNDEKIAIHHEPRTVIVHPKARTVDLYGSSESEFQTYSLVKDSVDWIVDEQKDTREMILTLYVK